MKVKTLVPIFLATLSFVYAEDVSLQERVLQMNSEYLAPTEHYASPIQEEFCGAPCSRCGSCHAELSYLYWEPCADSVFDFIEATRRGGGLSLGIDSKTKCATRDHESGIRLGVGCDVPCCDLDIGLIWTHFEPRTTRSAKARPGEEIIPFGGYALFPVLRDLVFQEFGQTLQTITSNTAKARWSLHLNLADLEFGKQFQCGSCLTIRPHIDLRYAHVEQSLKIKSEGNVTDGIANGTFKDRSRYNNDFQGVGPRVGLNTRFDLGCCWGVFAEFAAALVYGERDASFKEDIEAVVQVGTLLVESAEEEFSRQVVFQDFDAHAKHKANKRCTRTLTDAAIGFYWNPCLCTGPYDVSFKCGWEHHYFFNMGVAAASISDKGLSYEDKDLSVQGFTFSALVTY